MQLKGNQQRKRQMSQETEIIEGVLEVHKGNLIPMLKRMIRDNQVLLKATSSEMQKEFIRGQIKAYNHALWYASTE
jgi:hypothetical protein